MSTGKELQMEITQNNLSIDGGEEESDHLVTNSSYKELIGTDKREVCQIRVLDMIPSLILRTIDDERVEKIKLAYLHSRKDREGLTLEGQTFSAISNRDKSKILIIDGQHRLSMYKSLISEKKMAKNTKVDVSLVYVSDDSLNKACASTDGKELSTATDPSVLKASLTIMREGVLSNKYSESDQLRIIRYTFLFSEKVPVELRSDVLNNQTLLGKFLMKEFGLAKNPATDMAAALVLSERIFEKGLEISDRLEEKGRTFGFTPTTLYGYKLWQSIHLRDTVKYKDQLADLMDDFLQQPLAELNLSAWKQRLHSELPSARNAKRGPKRPRSEQIGDSVDVNSPLESNGENNNNNLTSFQENVAKIMAERTERFINKIKEEMEKGKTFLTMIQEDDDFDRIYPVISSADSSTVIFIRGVSHYRYLIENCDLEVKTYAMVSTPGQGERTSVYETVSRYCLLGTNSPHNSWIVHMNGRHYPSKTALSKTIRSQLGENSSIIKNENNRHDST